MRVKRVRLLRFYLPWFTKVTSKLQANGQCAKNGIFWVYKRLNKRNKQRIITFEKRIHAKTFFGFGRNRKLADTVTPVVSVKTVAET